ncbi:Ada metal-binding domain-containing protein [Pedobacter africanus]|uniref:Metal binding domain of Ada n=1 Tax=Pedobacter africanus TaxID=151894 RepID=A0A1W2CR30_9SPHI|nr:Ada metal-binding domain-containing protein [Pedobacter africanus]SMC87690.1 Metal binding domain of Ada [Pedobacter africanus]
MYRHITLGETTQERKRKLGSLIRSGAIKLAGYKKAGIYGLLSCSSGKRMKIENRVFFKDTKEAIGSGYRPCGHCLPKEYKLWKAGLY